MTNARGDIWDLEQQIVELKRQLARYREIFITYVREHEPCPLDMATELVDRLLGE